MSSSDLNSDRLHSEDSGIMNVIPYLLDDSFLFVLMGATLGNASLAEANILTMRTRGWGKWVLEWKWLQNEFCNASSACYGWEPSKQTTCSIVLLLTSIFSSIYHWHDQPNLEEGFQIIGTTYNTHKSLDFFCSYLSIFSVVFYGINPRQKPEHIDIALMIIVIICHILTLINIEWYFFCILLN